MRSTICIGVVVFLVASVCACAWWLSTFATIGAVSGSRLEPRPPGVQGAEVAQGAGSRVADVALRERAELSDGQAPRGFFISGCILNASGEPAENVDVGARRAGAFSEGVPFSIVARSRASGEFIIPLQQDDLGMRFDVRARVGAITATVRSVRAGDDVLLRLEHARALRLLVADGNGALVEAAAILAADSASKTIYEFAVTDRYGAAEIEIPARADVEVLVEHREFEGGRCSVTAGTEDVSKTVVLVRRANRVTVEVVRAGDAAPIQGALVADADREQLGGATDSGGRSELGMYREGDRLQIRASHEKYRPNCKTVFVGKGDTFLRLELKEGRDFVARVVDSESRGVAGAVVEVVSQVTTEGRPWAVRRRATSDSEGVAKVAGLGPRVTCVAWTHDGRRATAFSASGQDVELRVEAVVPCYITARPGRRPSEDLDWSKISVHMEPSEINPNAVYSEFVGRGRWIDSKGNAVVPFWPAGPAVLLIEGEGSWIMRRSVTVAGMRIDVDLPDREVCVRGTGVVFVGRVKLRSSDGGFVVAGEVTTERETRFLVFPGSYTLEVGHGELGSIEVTKCDKDVVVQMQEAK